MPRLPEFLLQFLNVFRYSIGEILATMQPDEDDEVVRDGPPVDFSFKDLRKFSGMWC